MSPRGPVAVAAAGADAPIADLMAKHDPILLYACRLLPPDVASDASALYAWCRRLDEITDGPGSEDAAATMTKLIDWERRFERIWEGRPDDEMDAALRDCFRRNPTLGRALFDDMMEGMKSDAVDDRRVANMEELEDYAYRVAGTVGLMLLPLLLDGEEDAEELAKDPAIALGKAIQMINILRDASPDAKLRRIYLPGDELSAAGVNEDDVLALRSSPGYREVVKSVSLRAEDLLAEAEAGRGTLPGLGPLFVQVIVELYRRYLDELKERGFENLASGGERVRISASRKLVATATAIVKVASSIRIGNN